MRRSGVWFLLVCVACDPLACRPRTPTPAAAPQPGRAEAAAADRRPIASYAALPAPGQTVPEFSFPRLGGGAPISSASLRGRPALIAFWSTYCPHARPAIDELQRLHREYIARGAEVIVLSGDEPEDIRAFEDTARTDLPTAVVGYEPLRARFDRSAEAPERARYRVEWVLPVYLVVDASGRIVRRGSGPHPSSLAPALDSLLAAAPD